jgi:structural maintenance of chromosome 2
MGKKEKRVDEITALLAEEIAPKLDTLRTERHSFIQYQKASAELERLAHVLRAYEWSDHRAKASRKDAQIAERERDVVQARCEKERATREAGIAEKNRVDLQTYPLSSPTSQDCLPSYNHTSSSPFSDIHHCLFSAQCTLF